MKEKIEDLIRIIYTYLICVIKKINSHIKIEIVRYCVYILLMPLFLFIVFGKIIYEYSIGKFLANLLIKKEGKLVFEDQLSIVSIIKNEGLYLQEWIEFHKLVGVNRFYIYDNGSSDNTYEVLKPYIDSGLVVYRAFPGKLKQLEAYNDAVSKYKYKTKYMGFIDLDEFVYPKDYNLLLPQILDSVMKKNRYAAGIGVNWCLYGSSGKKKFEKGFLIERFKHRAFDSSWHNLHIKSLVNPRMVKEVISPHFPIFIPGVYNVDIYGKRIYGWYSRNISFPVIRCNHYFCKSLEEYVIKKNRGLADKLGFYEMSMFEIYDMNDLYDDTAAYYAEKIKDNLRLMNIV